MVGGRRVGHVRQMVVVEGKNLGSGFRVWGSGFRVEGDSVIPDKWSQFSERTYADRTMFKMQRELLYSRKKKVH